MKIESLSAQEILDSRGRPTVLATVRVGGFSASASVPSGASTGLAEAIEVVQGLLSPGSCTFEGTHYRIDGLSGSPKPVQQPHLPLLIGGGGRKVLELAGRKADIVGLNPKLPNGVIDASAGPDATAEATVRKIGWVREAAGERFSQIELHTRIHLVIVTDDRAGTAEALAPAMGLSPAEALDSPHALCGTVDQIVDDLLERRERWGISSVGISLDAIDALAPVVAALAGSAFYGLMAFIEKRVTFWHPSQRG